MFSTGTSLTDEKAAFRGFGDLVSKAEVGCDVIYASRIPQSIPTHFPVSSFLAVRPRAVLQCLCFSVLYYEKHPPSLPFLPPPSALWESSWLVPYVSPHYCMENFTTTVHFSFTDRRIRFIRIVRLVRRGNLVFIGCDRPSAVCEPVLEAAFFPTLHCRVWLLNVTRTPFVVSYHFWSGTRWWNVLLKSIRYLYLTFYLSVY